MHVLRQPQNNYNRYTVDKEKKINAHRTKKKSSNRGRQQERSKGTITKKLQTRLKTNNKMAVVSPFLPMTTLSIKWSKLPKQKS